MASRDRASLPVEQHCMQEECQLWQQQLSSEGQGHIWPEAGGLSHLPPAPEPSSKRMLSTVANTYYAAAVHSTSLFPYQKHPSSLSCSFPNSGRAAAVGSNLSRCPLLCASLNPPSAETFSAGTHLESWQRDLNRAFETDKPAIREET